MSKRKVCVAVTARPSYSRIRSALTAIKARNDCELQLVVAASALLDRYGNAVKVMEEEGFKVDRQLWTAGGYCSESCVGDTECNCAGGCGG